MTSSPPGFSPPRKKLPIATSLTLGFKQYLGGRFRSAELTIEAFHLVTGVVISCEDKKFEQSEYFAATVEGVTAALTGLAITDIRIHILRAVIDDISSSQDAFENCAFQAVTTLAGVRPAWKASP